MLLGASNNIKLPGDCANMGGEVLCKLVADGESISGQAGAPKLQAGCHLG